jgi:hypothetical protein
MSEIAVLVVFFAVAGAPSPTSVGRIALAFPNSEACETWRREVRTQALREMFKPKTTDTIMSVCLAVVEAPPLSPCPQEREC